MLCWDILKHGLKPTMKSRSIVNAANLLSMQCYLCTTNGDGFNCDSSRIRNRLTAEDDAIVYLSSRRSRIKDQHEDSWPTGKWCLCDTDQQGEDGRFQTASRFISRGAESQAARLKITDTFTLHSTSDRWSAWPRQRILRNCCFCCQF
jgi:hypothetical protein